MIVCPDPALSCLFTQPVARYNGVMVIPPAPSQLLTKDGTTPFGLYMGPMCSMDLRSTREWSLHSAVWNAFHYKRWMYVLLTSDRYIVSVAVVHLGYGGTAFVMVMDRKTRRVLHDRGCQTSPNLVHVGLQPEQGCLVTFRGPRLRVSIVRPVGSSCYTVSAAASDMSLHATLDTHDTPQPVVAICPVPNDGVNVTTKRVLMNVQGVMTVDKHIHELDGCWGAIDMTHGLLQRQTHWYWAMGMGRLRDGRAVGFNLVDEFNDGVESVIWVDDRMIAVGAARFEMPHAPASDSWKVATDGHGLSMSFDPCGVHDERKNWVVLRSRFVQPMGEFSGQIYAAGDEALQLERVPGVVEQQHVAW